MEYRRSISGVIRCFLGFIIHFVELNAKIVIIFVIYCASYNPDKYRDHTTLCTTLHNTIFICNAQLLIIVCVVRYITCEVALR